MQNLAAQGRIRLLIVEAHPLIRAGIRRLLAPAPDIAIVGEAADSEAALDLFQRHSPDFIILDVELPVPGGDEVLPEMLHVRPRVRVLILSSDSDPWYVQDLLAQGARGCLLKEEAPALLLAAIRSIDREPVGSWLSLGAAKAAALPAAPEQDLSARERAILESLAAGRSESDIASTLQIPPEHLADYLQLLAMKFSARSLQDLVEIARDVLAHWT